MPIEELFCSCYNDGNIFNNEREIKLGSVYTSIQNFYENLTATEQLAIDYILKYPDLTNLKLKVIEQELHLSAPTIVRGIKKLHYHSFTEFKYAVVHEQEGQKISNKKSSSLDQEVKKCRNDILQTIAMLDQDKLLEIGHILKKAHHIFCVGVGSSAYVASNFNHRLKSIGLWSNDYTEFFQIRDMPEIVKSEDCLLVFSLNGSENNVLESISACKVKGCQIIAITGFSTNPLTELASISVRTHPSKSNREKMKSRLMLYVASDLLFEAIYSIL